jgi:hypothetical protein
LIDFQLGRFLIRRCVKDLATTHFVEFSMDRTESFPSVSSTTTSRKQSVRVAAASLAIGAVLAIGATPARADLTNLKVDINSGITGVNSVSYSQPAAGKQAALSVWAAFTVDVTNPSPNNVSNAWLTFINSQGTPFKAPPTINATGGATGTCALGSVGPTPAVICKVSMGGNSVGSLNFTLRALSPQAQNAQPPVDQMSILWSVQTGQGAAGSNPSQITNKGAGIVNLAAGSPTDLRGYIDPDTGLTVQDTGGSSTKVSPSKPATAEVEQQVSSSSCSNQYKVCLQSSLSIKTASGDLIQFNPPLIIDLLRAKSTLKGGAKIENAVLFYTTDDGLTTYQIVGCNSDGAGGWVIPPLSDRCLIPASSDPAQGTFVDQAGNWHLRVLAFTNGIINW